METSTKLGLEQSSSLVKSLKVPQAKADRKFKMGEQGTNYYQRGNLAGTFSVWTDSVGPCHAVLVYGTPKVGNLGMIGLAHVSGDHDIIVGEAKKLLDAMESTNDCEVFIIGGTRDWVEQGYTFDRSSTPSWLQGKVKLVISPASEKGGYIKVELTGAREIHVEKHT